MAPEGLKGMGYSAKSDIFSLGSLLFSILTHQNLFYAQENKHIMEENRKCNYGDLRARMQARSTHEIEFIRALLEKDPKLRPTAEEALQLPLFDDDRTAILNSIRINKILANEHNVTCDQLRQEVNLLELGVLNETLPRN